MAFLARCLQTRNCTSVHPCLSTFRTAICVRLVCVADSSVGKQLCCSASRPGWLPYCFGGFIQGAFQRYLLIQHVTNNAPFNAITFGKPELSTYEYANDLLQRILREATNDANVTVAPEDVWMIGDNPASDIEGANRFGWSSALVRTGVFRDVEGAPASRPTFIADNVEKAITEIMERSWST